MLKKAIIVILILFVFLFLSGKGHDSPAAQNDFSRQTQPDRELIPFLPEVFSTGGRYRYHLHSSLLFSPDGGEILFTVQSMKDYQKTIFFIKWEETGWSQPFKASFSGTFDDETAWLSSDGSRLYFISNRSRDGRIKSDREGLWMTQRINGSWSKPVSITQPEDMKWNEGPLFISAEFPGGLGSTDIYQLDFAASHYSMPRHVAPPVSSVDEEYFRCISQAGDFMIFYRFSSDNKAARGLYITFMSQELIWENPVSLSIELNLSVGFDAKLSPDNQYVYILNRNDGIYRIKTDDLRKLRKKR